MSHTATITTNIVDLDALAAAVQALGAQVVRNVTSFQQYRSKGKCHHVIRLPGVKYEVGVAESREHRKFDLLFDPFGFDGSQRDDGHKLVAAFGPSLLKIVQHYNVERTARLCAKNGKQVRRVTQPNGTISLYAQ